MFPLCATCAQEQNQDECEHSDEQRCLTGTWTHTELYRALDLNYTVEEVIEVYHFDHWMEYDGETNDTGLFTGYINAFLKIKQVCPSDLVS